MSTFTDQNTHPSSQNLDQSNFQELESSQIGSFKQLESEFLPANILQILSERNRPAIQAEQLDEYFRNLSFFEKLRSDGGQQINDLLLHEVWRNVEFTQIEANTLIFKEKEPSNNKMFIILKGKIGINIKPLQEELFFQGDEKSEQPAKQQKVNSKPKENNQLNDKQAEIKNSQQNVDVDVNDNDNNRNQSYQVSTQNNSNKQNEVSTPQKNNQATFRLDQQQLEENQQLQQSDSDSDSENQQSEQQENNPFPQLGRKVAELDSGKAFGEQALFKEGGFRNASVYTLEQTSFLVIWRDKFLGVLSVLEQIKQDKIERIGNVLPFFNDIVSSQLKDRLVYLFEDVTISKGTALTQENVKGSFIYVLRSGKVALEKSITLQEYKEKESQDVRRQTFQHRFSEFTTAELIGDEILEEKSKIYFHKKNLKPSEYLFTCIVLSSDAQFLRLDKKKVIDGFPKYIVEKLRENMLIKKKTRVKIIEDYVQRIQPNFVEYQKKEINMKKSLVKKFKISNNIVGHLLGENTPLSSSSSPSKKVQFQNIVRNSILPMFKNQTNYSLEANKTLIQDLQVIKLKKQKSNYIKKDADTHIQQESQKNSQFQFFTEEKGLGINGKQVSQQNSASFSNHFTKRQSTNISQKEDSSYTDNQHGSITSRSQFSKSKVTNNQSTSLTDNGMQESQNNMLQNGFSSVTNFNNYPAKNNLGGSINDIQKEYFIKGNEKNQAQVQLRLSQSIPSLANVGTTTNTELRPNPNFFYNHAEKLQKQKMQSQEEGQKIEEKNSKNPPKIMQIQIEKQKVEPLTEGQNRKIQNYKNQHISQISKKIDCDIMKKEIIYQHMTSLKEQKIINPFEDQNSKRQKQIKKEIQGVIQKVQKYSQEMQSQTNLNNTQTNKIKKTEESKGLQQSLIPIQETKQEELTSKQFININNQNVTQGSVSLSEFSQTQSNETVTLPTKLSTKPDSKKNVKFQSETEKTDLPSTIQSQIKRSKSSQRLESYSLLQEETENANNHQHPSSSGSGSHSSNEDMDPIQKKISALQGKHQKKFYMLQDTWDLGVENLKMKELDLRNDLQRKGIIQKPPLEQTNKDQFEKLDQHQLNLFKKYQQKKSKQLQKEKQQINNLFRMIQPEIKGQESNKKNEYKQKLNLDLQILQQPGQTNTQQSISSIKTITERTLNENNQNQSQEFSKNDQQKTKDHIQQPSLQLNLIQGNESNTLSIQQTKPNQNAQAKQKQYSQVSISTVQLSLPQISPSKKLSQKFMISQTQIGDNFNIYNNSSYKAKTEGDLEQELIRVSSEKVRQSNLINSPDKKQPSSIILELSPLLTRFQISQSSTNLTQNTTNPLKQVIANTESQCRDQQGQKAVMSNQQLPHIVYNNSNSKKVKPNQESQILQNKSKQIKQMQQIEFTKKELQKISSSSNMISPKRNQNEIIKQQLFLSPQSTKLLQKI
ncbi:hypothetical protein ABPG72_010675 [Tetrahymena utriculariae]